MYVCVYVCMYVCMYVYIYIPLQAQDIPLFMSLMSQGWHRFPKPGPRLAAPLQAAAGAAGGTASPLLAMGFLGLDGDFIGISQGFPGNSWDLMVI